MNIAESTISGLTVSTNALKMSIAERGCSSLLVVLVFGAAKAWYAR